MTAWQQIAGTGGQLNFGGMGTAARGAKVKGILLRQRELYSPGTEHRNVGNISDSRLGGAIDPPLRPKGR